MSEMIFNDVSLVVHQLSRKSEAEICFRNFISTVGGVISRNLAQPLLRSQICFQDIVISTINEGDWLAADWLADANVDREERNFILTLDTKIPIDEGVMLTLPQEEELINYEYKVPSPAGYDVFAFGFALQTNDIAISLPSDPLWDECQIDVSICTNGNLIRHAVVDHVSRGAHCDSLAQVILNRRVSSIYTAADFVREKGRVFPYLQFSPDVDEQVEKVEPYYLAFAIEKLVKMNETAAQWRTSDSVAPIYRFNWRGESESTMNRDAFRKARIFQMPGGGNALFENHLSFSSQHRLHFIEDRAAKTFVIGYIGDHLPTVKFSH